MKMFILITVAFWGLSTATAMAQVMTPAQYVAAAGAGDLYERQSSRIVSETSQDPRVQAFATMMIEDHGQSTAKVKAAAARSHVPAAAPRLTPLQAELIAELQATSGPARDATYVAQQKAAHGQALAVQKAYATEGGAPALKSAAAAVVPIVQHHIEMLKGM